MWAAGSGRFGAIAGPVAINAMSEQTAVYAGDAPHVVVADSENRVLITASGDGKVHVTDHTHRVGWFLGPTPSPLSVVRTADGVTVRRPDSGERRGVAIVGIDFQRTEVAVPPKSRIDIQRCDGAGIDGVEAGDVKIVCADGSLHFEDVQTPAIQATTADGSIRASNLRVGGGTLHTDDGSIHLSLNAPALTVRAKTADGDIRFNGARAAQDGDAVSAEYTVGTGGGALEVSTQDGSIHITTNGGT